jgi:hypothetical protein
MTSLSHYSFTWDDVLNALQRRMHDQDYARGITLLKPGAEKSDRPYFHHCRATANGIEISLFDEPPLVLKPAPRMGKDSP